MLSDEHADLLFNRSPSKVEKQDKPGEFLKVVIGPIFFLQTILRVALLSNIYHTKVGQ